ncbi:2Fe-2S iron-sulfur cluster binding domain-containing protein, partial [Nostoc sp. HG1]|nr:2Fe-2S iron-sulfur cluster binding domain-containing protein [Nostoc sp. HG1]
MSLIPHQNLSEHLTIQNSPVLFGCRTGICGTCLVEVNGTIPSPNAR